MRKRVLKYLTSITAILLSTIILFGCGNKKKDSANKATTVKISWRYTGKGDSMIRLYNDKWIKKFEKDNPDIKIKLDPIKASEGDYFSKLDLAMKSSETAPDIVNEDSFILPSDAKAGYLEPLDKYLENWDDWDQFTEALKSGGQGSNGKQYGIPGTTDARGVWTNLAVIDKAGLEKDWTPKNWQDIIDAAEKIKKTQPDVIPLAASVSATNGGESVAMQTFEQLLYGTGETLYDEKTKKWNVGSKGIEDTLGFIDTFMNKKKVGPSLSVAMSANFGSTIYQDKLPNNKAGLGLDGNWNTGNWAKGGAAPIENVEEVLNFNLMPTQNGKKPGYVTMSGGWTWAMPKKSKNHKAAFKVLKAMNTKEMCLKRALYEGTLTVRDDVAKDPEYLKKPFIKTATKSLQNAYFRPKSDLYPKVSVAIQQMVESVASNSKSPKQASEKFTSDVQDIVGKENTETQK